MIKKYNFKIDYLSNYPGNIDVLNYFKNRFAFSESKLKSRSILIDINVDLSKEITFITGFSGSGKSTLLKLILNDIDDPVFMKEPNNIDTPIIESLSPNIEDNIKLLTKVGLGEVYNFLTPYRYLSDSQKVRFEIASVLIIKPKAIFIDEFLSNLDRISAKSISSTIAKHCRRHEIKLFLATVHDDVIDTLCPDQIINFTFSGVEINLDKKQSSTIMHPIKKGTMQDIEQLKKYHYFNDLTIDETEYSTKVIKITYDNVTIGASVYVSPYPKEWEKVAIFREINKKLRLKFLSVIHPSFRGKGLSLKFFNPPYIKEKILSKAALYNYNPVPLKVGYREIESPYLVFTEKHKIIEKILQKNGVSNPGDLYDQDFLKNFLIDLDKTTADNLVEIANKLYYEMSMEEYSMFFKACFGCMPSEKKIKKAEAYLTYLLEDLDIKYVLPEILYFPMKAFLKS